MVSKSHHTMIDLLSENCPNISKQKLKLAMKYGAVWITPHSSKKTLSKTTRIRRAKKILQVGDQVHLYYNEEILFSEIKPASLVSDEGDYSIWNKPCGMFSQGSKWGDHTSIARWVELFGTTKNNLSSRPCFLVHRLDRATNGLILVAHSKQAASQLAGLFEQRKIEKRYSAVVYGEYAISPKPTELKNDIDGKRALTTVVSVAHWQDKNQSALLLEITTGRKHQIRKHLSSRGHAIVGDRLYGNEITSDKQPDLMLRCCSLEFECPLTNVLKSYQVVDYMNN